jgi:hypothetical protein
MASMTRRIAGDGIVREVIDRAEHVLLVGGVLVGVEVAGYAFNLVKPSCP